MASTVTENEEFAGGQFTPFQDSDTPRVESAVQNFVSATQGYDTTVFNQYRQGVSMRIARHVYETTQPKIWAGNLKHAVRVVTIGQARDFTEFENTPEFEELPEFNPVWYIEDETYPFPIIFNNGPQQEEEAIIEPFTIPFRKANPFGNFVPRTPRGSLEDGNNFDNYDGGTTRVEQFIEYNSPVTPRFFLDEGAEYVGTIIEPALLTNAFDPIANYPLTEQSFVSSSSPDQIRWRDLSGNNNPPLVDDNLVPFRVGVRTGPSVSSSKNPNVSDFNLTLLSGSAVTSSLQLTGDMTAQIIFFSDGTSFKYLFSQNIAASATEADNTLYQLGINIGANTFQYSHQHSTATSVFFNGTLSASVYRANDWNHIGFTRTTTDSSSSVTVYLNGTDIGTSELQAPEGGSNTILTVGNLDEGVGGYDGAFASLKIIDRALSPAEMQIEANHLFNPPVNLSGAIQIDGYVAFIQRDVDPFDDTRDEQIVEQISTTDATFIGRLKELDFDLSEDIRGTFDKKSAAAGGDVYGPDAARYGTDSVAFRGLIRGS